MATEVGDKAPGFTFPTDDWDNRTKPSTEGHTKVEAVLAGPGGAL